MRGKRGRRLPWLLGAMLLGAGTTLAMPVSGGADGGIPTAVTLTSSDNPAAYGDQLILTATVIPATGTAVPDGSVTFEDSGASLGTVALGPAGQAALAESALAVGTHQIDVEYSGSAGFAPSGSAELAQVISVQSSTTLLLPTVDPASYGETLVFVVSVAPTTGTGVPTGTVTLTDGDAGLGTATLAGGSAAVVAPALDGGDHSLTAAYAGDGNFSPSVSAPITESIEPLPTATALTVSPTRARTGQPVTLTASVTSAAATPDGTVTFSDGATTLGTGELSGGTATLVTCFSHRGSHRLTAAYAGTANLEPSTSAPVEIWTHGDDDDSNAGGCAAADDAARSTNGASLTAFLTAEPARATGDIVTEDGSTSEADPPQAVSVGAAPGAVDAGQSVFLTSVVFGRGDAGFPSGTVDFMEGDTLLGSAPAARIGGTADALASLRIALSAGSHRSITAVYHPDDAAQGWYSQAASAASAAVTVAQVAAATSLAVATSLNPSPRGQPLIVTATVNHPSSGLTPSGRVTFTVDGVKSGAVALDSLGQASTTLSPSATGTVTIDASYAGDHNFLSSASTIAEVVTAPRPSPTPTSAASPTPTPGARPTGPAAPSATPRPATHASPRPAAVIVPTQTPPPSARPSPSVNPDQLDTSAVPPIDLISLVSGIHMGSAPQIIVFLIIGNALLVGAILVTSRRGRKLTRRTLEAGSRPADQTRGDQR